MNNEMSSLNNEYIKQEIKKNSDELFCFDKYKILAKKLTMETINSVFRPAVKAYIAFSLSIEFDNHILGIKFKNVYISRYVGIGAQIVLRGFVSIFLLLTQHYFNCLSKSCSFSAH